MGQMAMPLRQTFRNCSKKIVLYALYVLLNELIHYFYTFKLTNDCFPQCQNKSWPAHHRKKV